MPQMGGAPLGQHTIWMFHNQNTMLLSKVPATCKYPMGGGKPLHTAKVMCDQRKHLKISQVWQHKLPDSSWNVCCESELSVCSRCSPYSLLTVLRVLFLIIDLLMPHRQKTFLFGVIFAESTACFCILLMFQIFVFRDLYVKTRSVQSHVCDPHTNGL